MTEPEHELRRLAIEHVKAKQRIERIEREMERQVKRLTAKELGHSY